MPNSVCRIDPCGRASYIGDLCGPHHYREQRYGDPLGGGPIRVKGGDVGERFWSKVDKDGPLPDRRPDLGPCWVWTRSLYPAGYGCIRIAGKAVYTHRWAYQSEIGAIPDGYEVDHLCRRRECVRPSHLEAVTKYENNMRSESTAAHNARQEVCDEGHPLVWTPAGKRGMVRACPICRRRKKREWWANRKARLTKDDVA